MTLNFNQLDSSNKNLYILEGIYPIENDKKSSWIWTKTEVIGIINNIQHITIQATSEIGNVLIYDNLQTEIKSNSLNIIKLNTVGKTDFQFSLKDVYNVPTDLRNLGIKIIGIFVDDERIY